MSHLIRVPTQVARRLCVVTLWYLAVPLLLFFLGWMRPVWGVPAALLLTGTLGVLSRRGWRLLPGEEILTREEKKHLRIGLLWTAIPVALLVAQIGAGGFGFGTYDWDNKHNIVFADLVRSAWPVVYRGSGTPENGLMLVYYVGYYLPAALVGKVLGWTAGNIAWQLWTQFGFLLVSGWFVTFAGARARWLGVLFLLFSGADSLGQLVHNLELRLHVPGASGETDWQFHSNDHWNATKSYYVLYRANVLQLFWAPQHLLVGWLGIALLLHRSASFVQGGETPALVRNAPMWDGAAGGAALLGWSLLVFWSPLIGVGCLPFLVALLVRELRVRRFDRAPTAKRERSFVGAGVWISSAVCVGVIGLYLAFRLPPPPGSLPQRGAHFGFLLGQLLRDEGLHAFWRYGVFVLLEFGLLCALVWPRSRTEQAAPWRAPLLVAVGTLLLLPCFIYGYYNDLVMRSSIPALAVVCVAIAVFFQDQSVSRARRLGVLVLLLLGSGGLFQYVRSSGRNIRHGDYNTLRPMNSFRTLVEEYRRDSRHLLTQYTATTDSPFARFLAKPPAP